MTNNFASQYDEIYQYGARNIISNKDYKEEFEYFAPLHITKGNFPKKFIIFRVDGPGIIKLDRHNVKEEVFQKFKTVKLFDLTKSTNLGEWIDKNFISNQYFPNSAVEINFDKMEFSQWNGIDYGSGGYTTKSLFLEDYLSKEKEIFEFEKFVLDGFKNNKVVYPNIINFSFLFDDTPADENSLKKWSINRYYGFYLDEMELIKTMSPYTTPLLKSDAVILAGNILESPSGDPFMEGWTEERPFYVEYNGDYFPVKSFVEKLDKKSLKPIVNKTQNVAQSLRKTTLKTRSKEVPMAARAEIEEIDENSIKSGTVITEQITTTYVNKWRIISDLDLKGKQSLLNKNTGYVNSTNKALMNYDNTPFEISDFELADLWIIEIDGVYHNLVKSEGLIKIYSDCGFKFYQNEYEYWVNKPDTNMTKRVSFIVDKDNPPKKFKIYRLKLTDIKDFDDRIVDTEYSKFEYEKEDELTITDETKMYFENYATDTNPKEFDDFIFNNEVVNIPVSSEYTANFETFKIENGDLSPIWRKNTVHCRWAYQNSISANDVPYLLNNSLIFEDYNRTTNPFDPEPKRIERNLDYFYTINSSTSSYIHHSLHVENLIEGSIDENFRFDLNKYLNLGTYSFDYFTYFFERKAEFKSGEIKKNVKKYSQFNKGDNIIPNISLFRGIEFRLYDVDSFELNSSNQIENINVKNSNNFEDYKISILLSENKEYFSSTSCFDLEIQRKVLNTICYTDEYEDLGDPPACVLTYNSAQGAYYSTILQLTDYVGWYINISGSASYYKVVSATISLPYVYLVIKDELTGQIANSLSLCNVCFSKVQNRIALPSSYIQNINTGDTLEINSNCYNGSYTIFDEPNWSFQNTVSVEDVQSTAPIYFKISVSSALLPTIVNIEYISYKSNVTYNSKYYYTLYLNTTVSGYALWDSNENQWKLWQNFIGGTPSNQLAYLDDNNAEYPIGINWIDVNPLANYSYLSEFRAKTLSLTCSGTVCHTHNYTSNDLEWEIIDDWQMNKEYATSSIVLFEDILYISNTNIDDVTTQTPFVELLFKKIKSAPYNLSQWDYYTPTVNVFWSPEKAIATSGLTYSSGDFIYNYGEYYQFNDENGYDIWNPEIAKTVIGYNNGDVVLFKGNWYISLTFSNNYSPDYTKPWFQPSINGPIFKKFWDKTTEPVNQKWKPIEMWNPSTSYNLNNPKKVIHNEIVYSTTSDLTLYPLFIEAGEEPGVSNYWIRIHSFLPDTNFIYNSNNNPIIEMNNKYYLCKSNLTNSTLENGIIIYINKKWKNVLVNIAINDNTLPNLRGTDRDVIYNELYSKLTAYNFIESINDISNKYGFSDYVKYVIINENGTISNYSYDNNINSLPCILKCEKPDEMRVKIKSLDVISLDIPSQLKAKKQLINSKINVLSQLNWYSKVPLAYSIVENQFPPKIYENFNGNTNFEVDVIYRYTGYYMPLFYEIQLFNKDSEYSLVGNYKFDLTLTDFGILKERKFRKVNHEGSILKLKELSDYKSIYPMLDEFGYAYEDFFIFRSTWDLQYHNQTVINNAYVNTPLEIFDTSSVTTPGQPISSQNQNYNL
jgi:hypothetical protein